MNVNMMNNMLGNIGMNANSNGTNGGNSMMLDNKGHNLSLLQSMNAMNDKSVLNLMPTFEDPVEQSLASLEQSLACKYRSGTKKSFLHRFTQMSNGSLLYLLLTQQATIIYITIMVTMDSAWIH